MCRMFSGQDPANYASQTRSVRLGGHSTSIRLEAAFWQILEEIAAGERMSLPKFLTTLHDEVLTQEGYSGNFASLLRCACLTHISELHGAAPGKVAARDADFDVPGRPETAVVALYHHPAGA